MRYHVGSSAEVLAPNTVQGPPDQYRTWTSLWHRHDRPQGFGGFTGGPSSLTIAHAHPEWELPPFPLFPGPQHPHIHLHPHAHTDKFTLLSKPLPLPTPRQKSDRVTQAPGMIPYQSLPANPPQAGGLFYVSTLAWQSPTDLARGK